MVIEEIINKYTRLGHNYRNAQNLASEEIILTKIASSPLAEHVTLKGGIVMFNITNNDRRVTQDIDFDLIRYSIDDESIKRFINKLNTTDDGVLVSIEGNIEKLHQEDYQGVRVHLLLKDKEKNALRIKLDIGVHTYTAIEQNKTTFLFEDGGDSLSLKINPNEQIFSEKLLSLARFGPLSTRYKDIYDLYYLINKNLLDINKVRTILELFLASSKRSPHTILDLVNSVNDTFDNKDFALEASKPASRWVDVDYDIVKNTILDFVSKL